MMKKNKIVCYSIITVVLIAAYLLSNVYNNMKEVVRMACKMAQLYMAIGMIFSLLVIIAAVFAIAVVIMLASNE